MSKYKKILFDRAGTISTITFNRPAAHNALDREMSDELADAVRAVKKDRECRFLIFRGAGDTFCAGDDIKDFLTWTDDDPYWQARQYQETAQMIEDLTCITIAAVDGVCTGGGLELTLTCDFVVATDRSRWGMPEIDWDITPGWGGVTRLARFAGRRKAKEWNLIGQLFDAKTAERHDLINRICKPADLSKSRGASRPRAWRILQSLIRAPRAARSPRLSGRTRISSTPNGRSERARAGHPATSFWLLDDL